MSPRAGIIAGKSIIVVQVQDSVDAALKRIGSNLNKFSAKVNRLGFEMFSGGFLGSLGLTALAKQFEDFEDKLLFLSTKLVATEAELAGVEKTIRALGRSTSFTAAQVADAATVLAQAGFNAAQVTKLLQPTLDLARGAQIDLAASGAILANTLRSFSLETEKATEVASQFIAAARLGTLDVLDLKESIKEVLGTVRNLNIDLPTTLALITQLAERSLKGTKAGTSLNTALLQLASKGKQLAKLGLVLPENIDGPGFIKFLEDLYKNINKLGNLKRTAVLQSIFNIRGGRAITALDDIKKIIDLQKQIAAAGDEARKAAVKMDSGFGGAIRRASSAIEGLTLRWGKLLADAIIPTLDLVPALSLALEQLTKANQTLVTGLILSPVAILGLGAGLLVASFAAAKLAGVIGLLAGGIRGTGRLIGGLLTQQLTNVAVLMDRIRKSARSFDRGLSAALLTPQLKGGRGRNARKVKPTSFLGRVGATQAGATAKSGLGAATAATNYLVAATKSLYTNLKALGPKAVSVYSRMAAAISKALAPNKRLLAQQRAFRRTQIALIQLNTDSVTPKLPESKALVSIGNKQNAALAKRVSITKKLATINKQIGTANVVKDVSKQLTALNKLEKVGVARVRRINSVNEKIQRNNETRARRRATYEKALADSRARTVKLTGVRNESFFAAESTGSLAKRAQYLAAQRALDIEEVRQIKFKAGIAQLQERQLIKTNGIVNRQAIATQRRNLLASKVGPNVSGLLVERETLVAEAANTEKALNALAARRNKLEVARIARGQNLVNKAVLAGGIKQAALQAKLARIGRFKSATQFGATFAKTSTTAVIAKTGTALARLWSGGLKLVVFGFRTLWKIDFVRIFLSGAKAVWSLTKAFGALAAIGFKTLTTLSGWGNILTFLLIFGPKIKFIREAFTRLGSGIAAAFRAIGMIGTAVGPAFTLIARSMKTLLAGQGDLGFDQLTTGLSAIVSIVGNQLSQAWDHVALAIAPAYDLMSKMISATFELGGLLGSVFGSTFGTTVMNFGDLFAKGFSGQSMGSMLKELFDAIDLKTIFIGISLLIKSIGDQLLMVFKGLYDVVADTMQELTYALASFLQLLPTTFFGQGGKVAGAQLQASVSGMDLAQLKAGKLFEQASLSLTKSLDGVIGRLENIFNAPAMTPAKIKALNLSYTESQVQQMLLEFANQDAGKKAQQRVNKLTSPNPTILGSLAVQDRRSPILKLQEEMTKLRRKIAFNNTLPTNEAGFIPFNIHRKNVAMREKLADIRTRIREELKAQRQMPISAPQRAVLSDIVSSTTGSFQQTRRNLVKLASGQSVEQKSLTALEQIQDNTSATTGNLDQILQNGLPVTMGLK